MHTVTLTPRELHVLALLGRGYTNQQVADELHFSLRTIENARRALAEKFGVNGRRDLVQAARDGAYTTDEGSHMLHTLTIRFEVLNRERLLERGKEGREANSYDGDDWLADKPDPAEALFELLLSGVASPDEDGYAIHSIATSVEAESDRFTNL